MDPLGIILISAFMALLVILGAALAVVGTIRLRQLARGGPEGHVAISSKAWERTIVVMGLLFTASGLYGGLRLIWGS